MKIKTKLILVLSILCVIFSINIIPVFAASDVLTETGIGENLDAYNPKGPSNINAISSKAGVILGAIQLIGTVLSVIILIVIGIKYMVSSVGEKAEYKKTFMLYVIGVVLLFAATSLPKLIYDLTTQALD